MPLEKYSVWAQKTKVLEGRAPVSVAPSGPKRSRLEAADGWKTGMEDPAPERAMVKSLLAWIDQVVMPFRRQLTAPAQAILDKGLLAVMHLGKGKTYAQMAQAADDFCDRVEGEVEKVRVDGLIKPSELRRLHPELFPGGMGLRLETTVPPASGFAAAKNPVEAMHLFGRCGGLPEGPVRPRGRFRVHEMSRRLFEAGTPGSAWTGICQMGRRCNQPDDVIYLVPNAAVGSHLGFDHSRETKAEVKPGEHGFKGETSHHYACVMIETRMGGFEIDPAHWNGRAKQEWTDPQTSGIFWGFSIVRAFNILGHLYAWTSVSTNRFGSSVFYHDLGEADPTLTQDQYMALSVGQRKQATQAKRFGQGIELGIKRYVGDNDVAVDWACAIWQATKDLA